MSASQQSLPILPAFFRLAELSDIKTGGFAGRPGQHDYGDGWWDEWFVRSDNGKESWVSVDEGEIAIETLVQDKLNVPAYESLKIGSVLNINRICMTVIEMNTATMIGAQGELPFRAVPGEKYNYIDLLGPKRASFTIEYQTAA